MPSPHERCEFTHAATYAVTVTYTVAGGARHGTAARRAEQIAARVANAAARAKGVVEVTAQAGHSVDGQIVSPLRVRFTAANSGHGTYSEPAQLDRYLDPDHELALRSLADANAAYRARRDADRCRRRDVDCVNASPWLGESRACACVYCDPETHHAAVRAHRRSGPDPFIDYRCVCGTPIAAPQQRCIRHRDVTLVLLADDPVALRLLVGDTYTASEVSPDPERDQ